MKSIVRVVAPLAGLFVAAACSSTTPSPGVPNAQPSGGCLDKGATCAYNAECCSQECQNGVCVRKQP
jgi:hypothetical protein